MVRCGLAEPRFGVDRFQPHLPQQPAHMLMIHGIALAAQPRRHPANTIKRRGRVLPVQQPHERHILGAGAHRLIVQPRPGQAQQGTMTPQTEPRMVGLYQLPFRLNRDAQLFFQPVELDFQLSNLLIERRLQRVLLLRLGATATGKDLGHLLQDHFLPLGDLHGMDPVFGRQLIDRPLPVERFQGHFGFEFCTMLSPHCHLCSLPHGPWESNLWGGPNFGVHYSFLSTGR
jgi:hypothetical protein